MSDYDKLYEVLENAEVLSSEFEDILEVATVNETTGKSTTVVFKFNDENELISIYTED